jgi:alkylhydroperoxidase family enzyme
VKIHPEEIALNRTGRSSEPKTDAALRFAKKVTETRGHVSDSDLAEVRDAGYTDAQVLEIIALAAAYLLTNFLNNVADTDIEFPDIEGGRLDSTVG